MREAEVQEIDRAFVAALAAGEQADGEDQHEGQSDDLFHDVASQLIFRCIGNVSNFLMHTV